MKLLSDRISRCSAILAVGKELHAKFLQPIWETLEDMKIKHLIVSPEGDVARLPLVALPLPRLDSSGPQTYVFHADISSTHDLIRRLTSGRVAGYRGGPQFRSGVEEESG